MVWTLQRDDTLALPVDQLGLRVLRDYRNGGAWNWQNWMRGSEQSGTANSPEVARALSEAWGWLINHGLVARDPTQFTSSDAVFVTRLGDRTLEPDGLRRLRALERIGVDLHPLLADRVQQQYLLGEHETAVFVAMRTVEVRVRELAGLPDTLIGTKLVQQAFAPNGVGPLTDAGADPGEQVAAMELFKGAIGTFKNPVSHRVVSYNDPVVATETVLLADLLLRLLDLVQERLRTTPPTSAPQPSAD